MENQNQLLTPSDFINITNQTFDMTYSYVVIEGEVDSFKINQGKFVFFNLKDEESSLGCFMMRFNLHIPIEDGMKIRIKAHPKITSWGKFSLTVESLAPVGEGTIKKSFEKLKAQLEAEGLFNVEHKKPVPLWPKKVAVVSSKEAAGYGDFMRLADDLTFGVEFDLYHVQVQGFVAPEMIEKAISRVNNEDNYDALVLIRGGGSTDDLAVFNDERVVRAIYKSEIPVVTGIGHEIDVTLADLVSDQRGATPSHVASLLFPDKKFIKDDLTRKMEDLKIYINDSIDDNINLIEDNLFDVKDILNQKIDDKINFMENKISVLNGYNPYSILKKGYAILRGEIEKNSVIDIETDNYKIKAKVEEYDKK